VCSFCEGIYFDAGELDKLFLNRESVRKGFLGKLLKL
jgi:Zn-finger nucleic acid-binding protein